MLGVRGMVAASVVVNGEGRDEQEMGELEKMREKLNHRVVLNHVTPCVFVC
jgi:hypothetical protein